MSEIRLTLKYNKQILNPNSKYGLHNYTSVITVRDHTTGDVTEEPIHFLLQLFIMKIDHNIILQLEGNIIENKILDILDVCKLEPTSLEFYKNTNHTRVVIGYRSVYIDIILQNQYNMSDISLELNPGISNHPDRDFRDLINRWLKYRTGYLEITENESLNSGI